MSLDRPVFIHLIGLEGCGHHGIFPIFEKVLTDKYAGTGTALYFRRGLRRYINNLYYKRLPKAYCVEAMAAFLARNRNSVIVDDNSYPSSGFREPDSQWDFAELYNLLKDHCEVKYGCISRNIFNTVNSHPRWDGGLVNHARVLAENAKFIDAGISALAQDGIDIVRLDYDRIGRNVAEISALTGCDAASVEPAIRSVFVASDKDYRELLSDPEVAEIERLFAGGAPD